MTFRDYLFLAGACVSADIDTDRLSAGGELAEKIRECAEGYL